MCVADVTRQEVSVCWRKCKHLFLPRKNKRTTIMYHIKVKTTCSVHHYNRNYLLSRSNFTCVMRTVKSCIMVLQHRCRHINDVCSDTNTGSFESRYVCCVKIKIFSIISGSYFVRRFTYLTGVTRFSKVSADR